MLIFKESQKKVVDNKIIDYPIASIQLISDTDMKVVCRDEKSIKFIKNVIALVQRYKTAENLPLLEYKCIFSEDSLVLDFLILGDSALAISDFAECKIISDKLKADVIETLNLNHSCPCCIT